MTHWQPVNVIMRSRPNVVRHSRQPSNFRRYHPYKRGVFNDLRYFVPKKGGALGQQVVNGRVMTRTSEELSLDKGAEILVLLLRTEWTGHEVSHQHS